MVFPRVFSLATATRALPLVKAIAADLAQVRREREALLEGLGLEDLLVRDRDSSGRFQGLARLHLREAELVEELAGLGIRVVDPVKGRVVFPARLEGVPGLLFWRLGQEAIEEWRPIPPEPGFPRAADAPRTRLPGGARNSGSAPEQEAG